MLIAKIQLDKIIDELINVQSHRHPYIDLQDWDDSIIIDGHLKYDELIKLATAVKKFKEAKESNNGITPKYSRSSDR